MLKPVGGEFGLAGVGVSEPYRGAHFELSPEKYVAERLDDTVLMEAVNAPMWAADNTHWAERTWWLRIPTHTGWMKVDFREHFAQ